MTTESIHLQGKHGLQFLFAFGLKWSVLLFVNKILSISSPPVTCTSDIYMNKASGALGGIPSISDLLVAGGTVLVFKLPQITQAEGHGERTEPKSLRPSSAVEPVSHSYRSPQTLEPVCLQLRKPALLEPVLGNKRTIPMSPPQHRP